MNMLSAVTEIKMSTREIAQLLGKQHSNIRISAERLAEKGTIALQGSTFEHNGNMYNEWLLNKRDSLVLVAQNCPEFTAAIVDRWQELENRNQLQVPGTFAEALMLAANQAVELEQKNHALAMAAPKVEFAERVAGADKGVKLGQYAKAVGLGPVTIFRILRELRIFMSRGDSYNLPYQEYVERGYFTVKQGTFETNSTTRISHTAMITGKGEQWLTKRLIDTGHLTARAV